MILIVAWPNWSENPDRLLMFVATSEWVEAVYLLTVQPLSPELEIRLPTNVHLIYAPSSISGWSFRKWARSCAAKIMAQAGHDKKAIILHDLAIARLLPAPKFPRSMPRSKVRTVLSLYTPTYSNFRDRHWRAGAQSPFTLKQEWNHFRVVLIRLLQEYLSVRFADAVTGNSEQIRQDVISGYRLSPQQAFYIPTAVDADYFCPQTSTKDKPPIILFCGRMYARKGVFDLLEAGKQLLLRGYSFRLLFVGHNVLEAPQVKRAVLEQQLEDVTTILPHQPRNEIRKLMQRATLLVLPSYLEGSPRVVKEAMAAGCPVVTYDLPGTRQLDKDGNTLKLVSLGNREALAKAIVDLLDSPEEWNCRRHRGLQLTQTLFSPHAVAHKMVNLYSTLLDKP